MTPAQRERWNTQTLERTRKHLQKNLQILKSTDATDKREIETKVMAEIGEAVSRLSDSRTERGSILPSFESDADTLALDILQEQDWRRQW